MADLIIHNCGQLVTMEGPSTPRRGPDQRDIGLVDGGAVVVAYGLVVDVGPESEVLSDRRMGVPPVTIDAGGRLVTPGLVDPHTHLVFAGSRANEFEMRALGRTYADIMAAGGGIHATVASTRAASHGDLLTQAEAALARMQSQGTTTVEAKSGYGLDLETELKQLAVIGELARTVSMDVVATFMGAHAIPRGMAADDYVDFVVDEAIPAVAAQGIARFCDVFCEAGVFSVDQSERILRAGLRHGLRPKIHADELGDTGGATLAARIGAISAGHLHCAGVDGLRAMANAGTVAVLLPGTGVFLGMRDHAPARQMIDMGIPVALGTDYNPGSCYAESLPLMMTFACTQLGLTPAEALVAVTINAACAIDMADRVGSLEQGKQADLVVWDTEDYRDIAYHMGANLVKAVYKRGTLIYGRID